MEGHLHAKSFGGTCNWPHTRGARLIEVAATAGGTVFSSLDIQRTGKANKALCYVVM